MSSRLILILAIACVFIGRAWQHLRWDGPYRTIFWDEQLFGPILELFSSQTWTEYVTSAQTDSNIQALTFSIGLVFVFAAICTALSSFKTSWIRFPIVIATGLMIFMVFCIWKERFYQIGQLLEYGCQIGAPILLLRILRRGSDARWVLLLKLSISFTFTGHGLYAVGYHPQPGPFNDMLLNIFGVEQATANIVLIAAGILDFVCAIAIWLPIIQSPFVWYLIVWGFLTAFARIAAGITPGLILYTLEQTWHETVFRLAHGLLPLLLLPKFKQSILSAQKEHHAKPSSHSQSA